MKTVEFLGIPMTKVILGDNPFIGNSYVPETYPRKEMFDYYQADKVINALFAAEENGINTYMALADNYLIRLFQQYRRDGGKMKIMFQTCPSTDLQANIWQMMECEPVAIYHQGSTLEEFLREGKKDILMKRLELIRSTGAYVGLGTHVPEILLQAERENWGMDFYMTCLYNYQNQRKGEQSSFFTNKPKYIVFYPEDPPKMYEAIKQVQKPCIAFKIFAGGQVFNGKTPEEIPGVLENVYSDVFGNIKPGDLACIGVYQKFKDQIKENAEIAEKVLNSMA
ncbi:MAG: hypothetical protein FWG34_05025 [Oscillospiraceae bacterium]|nr:hypothetical protein [Oscillospiraceae bacterium]